MKFYQQQIEQFVRKNRKYPDYIIIPPMGMLPTIFQMAEFYSAHPLAPPMLVRMIPSLSNDMNAGVLSADEMAAFNAIYPREQTVLTLNDNIYGHYN